MGSEQNGDRASFQELFWLFELSWYNPKENSQSYTFVCEFPHPLLPWVMTAPKSTYTTVWDWIEEVGSGGGTMDYIISGEEQSCFMFTNSNEASYMFKSKSE